MRIADFFHYLKVSPTKHRPSTDQAPDKYRTGVGKGVTSSYVISAKIFSGAYDIWRCDPLMLDLILNDSIQQPDEQAQLDALLQDIYDADLEDFNM